MSCWVKAWEARPRGGNRRTVARSGGISAVAARQPVWPRGPLRVTLRYRPANATDVSAPGSNPVVALLAYIYLIIIHDSHALLCKSSPLLGPHWTPPVPGSPSSCSRCIFKQIYFAFIYRFLLKFFWCLILN